MGAGPIKILPWDGSRPNEYQLCKSLTTAQTALTAAKLSEGWEAVQGAEDNHEVIGVEPFTAIKVMAMSVAADTNDDVLTLVGWPASGPGQEIGYVDVKYGTHTSAATTGFHANDTTHVSIRNAYAPATAYALSDTYAATGTYEAALTAYTGLANYPGHFIVSFALSQYKYFGIAATTVGGTTCGAIFIPVGYKSSNISPDGY